jgi:CheY-like chemotaxis protein
MLWIDPEQFEKVIINLLSNAFKSTPEGGSISILVNDNIQNVSITVQDNGKGIKPEHFDNIFKTFFSYEEGAKSSGTGIGLALAKSLIELHHGKIDVDSIQNEVTKFTVTLPTGKDQFTVDDITIHQEEYDDVKQYMDVFPENTTIDLPQAVTDESQLEKKLLIVEDNAEVSSFLVSVFNKEYIVLEANDGMKGMEVALAEIPDVIISDVMMPEKDGITLCKELKTNINTCHIPVILLTARTSLVFQLEGLNLGADDYITKPFNSKLLQLKVRNLLRLREVIQRSFTDSKILRVEPHAVTLTSRDEAFVEKALKSVEDNMSNVDYSIEDLCKDVGMSKTSLFRKLKAMTGQSANEFIRTIRLKRAAQLLPQHELSIAEVAYAVGFNDPKYFRICFKKLFNVSPSEYSNRAESGEEL